MAEKKVKILSSEKNEPMVEMYQDIFQIVKNNKNYNIGCANRLVVEENFRSKAEAKAFIDSKPWKLIVNVTCLIHDLTKEKIDNKEN